MKIKGSTKITLTDVNTGEVKEYNDENMLTKGLEVFASGYGAQLASINRYCLPMTQRAIGGIMLFEDKLEENENLLYAPANVKQTGKASTDVNVLTTETTMGTWNELESGPQEDGSYKYTFDFSTAQANGVINCVSLTSPIGGIVGHQGFEDVNYKYYRDTIFLGKHHFSDNARQLLRANEHFGYSASNKIVFADGIKNKVYFVSHSNLILDAEYPERYLLNYGGLRIMEYDASFTKVFVNNERNIFNNPFREIHVPLPQDVLTALASQTSHIYCSIGGSDDGKIYFICGSGKNIPNGATYYCVVIDPNDNFSTTTYSIVNQAATIYFRCVEANGNHIGITAQYPQQVWYYNGFIYATDKDGENATIWKIDPNTKAHTQIKKYSNVATNIYFGNIMNMLGKCYIAYISVDTGNRSNLTIVDPQEMLSYELNTELNTINNSINIFALDGFVSGANDSWIAVAASTISVYGIPGLYVSPTRKNVLSYDISPLVCSHLWPSYLVSINNLSSTITKTATQSMKVVYSLTFEEEETTEVITE